MHYKRWYRTGNPLKIRKVQNDGRMKHPYYQTHADMIQRCYTPTHVGFRDYGARGVRVCDRWRGVMGFWNFIEDMGAKPDPKYTIDRINPKGNYEPSNCRWASITTQSINKRVQRSNKSGVVGVCFIKGIRKWEANIAIHHKRILLGRFQNKEDAIKARQEGERKHHLAYR